MLINFILFQINYLADITDIPHTGDWIRIIGTNQLRLDSLRFQMKSSLKCHILFGMKALCVTWIRFIRSNRK